MNEITKTLANINEKNLTKTDYILMICNLDPQYVRVRGRLYSKDKKFIEQLYKKVKRRVENDRIN